MPNEEGSTEGTDPPTRGEPPEKAPDATASSCPVPGAAAPPARKGTVRVHIRYVDPTPEQRAQFEGLLDRTVARLLAEIDAGG